MSPIEINNTNEEGVLKETNDHLSLKARLGLQAKNAIENKSLVNYLVMNHITVIICVQILM